jgi:hypothetical protein
MKHVLSVIVGLVCIASTVSAGFAAHRDDIELRALGINTANGTCTAAVGTPGGEFFSITGTFHIVVNPAGNILFRCSGDIVGDPPEQAIKFNGARTVGFSCFDGQNFVGTSFWTLQLTPSGNGEFTCHVNGQQ